MRKTYYALILSQTVNYSFQINPSYYKIEMPEPSKYFSSAPFNGGYGRRRIYINRHVNKTYNHDPEIEIGNFLSMENIGKDETVVTLTSVDISKFQRKAKRIWNYEMEIFITAGFENAVSIGNRNNLYGTINICLITDLPLTDSASINLMQSMIEAKSQCMNDFHIADRETGKPAPGTSTDTITLFILSNDATIKYGGRITEYGYNASELVYETLSKIIENDPMRE
ncbi:adenosylcobinamide amidohydrolase [Cuniculiplasma sp. SKW3]|uniref:adenosylcobinamide amidohydrolase n=1 Tax=Cuniculiplasma sp. SKW3 TaxID=3400170 RepID=UPI003FD3D4E0